MKLIAQHKIDGQHDVSWLRMNSGRFQVAYGGQVTTTDDARKAAEHFGRCVQHQAECHGPLEDLPAIPVSPKERLYVATISEVITYRVEVTAASEDEARDKAEEILIETEDRYNKLDGQLDDRIIGVQLLA